ncbi:bacterial ammonia monooxygenase, subunit AmoB [methanotrophic endosymbiont of Bathymodiolus puteoserpentis (Logatchev)]|jgi:methane/ammonia monooxygenase subunit B|uniref:bacterial ammonia monooxygenase, subunit AmoB n=1 Tax=methanotrophic endosymbiont of Bathymodiolus puteoserpentis (Logatchev) TaxID=343235 RepID=UPI0013C9777D|nr:bacterial ammonia monooxygenase, subunit AmoB [methanotrophic endosymbiont of Bathymodiolus puteoserpentis (Logatchev)]SHE20338.1 Particulate methane monooxygenase B-subunit [methanotrophic endosymbiont of Bathymodiolus puteoserpentis (Logatchev)]
MKTIKDKVAKLSFVALLMALTSAMFYTPTASAHGEKSQAAFMRMRTIHWFDLDWSKDEVAVNDTMTISGKFHVFAGWPETVDKPEVSFLNIGIPGPVFIRAGSWIGGQLVPRSVSLELGDTYEFKVLLKARRPGDWHVHTMMNVEGGGPIIGPGKWVTITGSMSEFVNPLTTLTGQTIDLEDYALDNVYFWHALWYSIGLAWLIFWIKRPMFIPRHIAVTSGKADTLISATDKKVAIGFAVGTLALLMYGMGSTNEKYPITTPLQAGLMRGIKPIEMPETSVAVKVEDATYRVPGRAMQMTLTITNNGDSAIRLGEFNTASVRFLDADVLEDESGYPDDLLAEEGLTVSDNSPIAPGESRTVEVTASDAAWEVYRLADLIYDPDSRFAGLLFFFDEDGNRQMVMVDAPLIPSFI